MRRLIVGLVAAIVLSSVGRANGDNLIVNGSFEHTPVNMEGAAFITLYHGDAVSIANWIVKSPLPNDGWNHDINLVNEDWEAADGLLSIDLNGERGPGGIAQIFATTPGNLYDVSFMMAGNPDPYFPVKRLNVVAAGQSQEFSFDNTGRSPTEMGWEQRLWSFTATDVTTELWFHQVYPTFEDWGGAGTYGSALDNVEVFDRGPTAVPAPSSLVTLAGVGVMVFGMEWWKKRRRQVRATA